MLPSFLQDSYRQYKNDTNRFAIWLVNFAKKVGLEPACLSSTPAAKRKKKDTGQPRSFYRLSLRCFKAGFWSSMAQKLTII